MTHAGLADNLARFVVCIALFGGPISHTSVTARARGSI
jgi:hypothetical protein